MNTYMVYSQDDSFRYLSHHGIKGQKWGIRRYQNEDGSLTSAGKKRYSLGSEPKAKNNSRNKEKYDKAKKEAIRSGDAKKISKYYSELSSKEIEEAISRIDMKQRIDSALSNQSKTVTSGKRKVDSVMSKIGTIYNYTSTIVGLYDLVARVNNAFNPKFDMPVIRKGKK